MDIWWVDSVVILTDDFSTFLILFMKFLFYVQRWFLCNFIWFQPLMPIKCDFLHAKSPQLVSKYIDVNILLSNDCMWATYDSQSEQMSVNVTTEHIQHLMVIAFKLWNETDNGITNISKELTKIRFRYSVCVCVASHMHSHCVLWFIHHKVLF